MQQVRLGVIGCGVTGKFHLKALGRIGSVQVVAVADVDQAKAHATAEQFAVPTVHADAQALLSDPAVDAVILALPTQGRANLAIRAFQAGKHVLLEKPTALHVGEIQQMRMAQGNLIGACCSSRYRFTRAARMATEFIAGGHLGQLQLLRCRAVHEAGPPPQSPPPRWRASRALNGGGLLVNWGIYDLDFLLGVTGWSLAPQEVLAQTWRIAPHLSAHVAPDSDAESHYTALIRCAGPVMVTLERGEFLATTPEDVWEISGSMGTLRIAMLPSNGLWSILHTSAVLEQGTQTKILWSSPATADDVDRQAALDGPTEDFIAAIQENRPPRTGLDQAMVLTSITDAIYASAERGTAVAINHPPG